MGLQRRDVLIGSAAAALGGRWGLPARADTFPSKTVR
jgi:hypothetical protein